MEKFQPFEANPHMAIAVSGGIDSLALVKLALPWVQAQGGQLTALHVDHGLREESDQEAQQVKTWMEGLGIPCHILQWQHGLIASGIQQKARDARYGLLLEHCAREKILHLLIAHHEEDAIETLKIRKAAQSGEWGLAGMSACQEFEYTRILRPLLGFTKEGLKEILGDHPHVEDPSNQNLKFQRVQVRQQEELFKDALLETLDAYGAQRWEQERFLLSAMSVYVSLFQEGYALIDPKFRRDLPFPLSLKFLGHVLRCIGGLEYLPREVGLQSLFNKLQAGTSATCGGCHLRFLKDQILVTREARTVAVVLSNEAPFLWDNRFFVNKISKRALGLRLQRLGMQGWAQIKKDRLFEGTSMIEQTFPALWEGDKVIDVPLVSKGSLLEMRFKPRNSLLASLFV
jgi:tRNA(Ile)-lysidine synthase